MRWKAFAVALITLASLSGCAQSPSQSFDIAASDVESAKISSNQTPEFLKVVALANGAAEIIDSLGLKSILIGRDVASTEPALKDVPIVTSGHQVVAEKIIALSPDLVIIDSSVGPSEAITALKGAGIAVKSIEEVWSVNAISSKIREIASILGVGASGEQLISQLNESIAAANQKVEGSPRVLFLYLRGGNSIYLVGGEGSGADSMLAAIGAIDVGAQRQGQPFTPLTAESLIQMNPEILLVMSKGLESVGGVSGLVNLPGVAQTLAGKNSRVISVDDSLLLSFGTRTPSLLNQLALAINEVQK